MIKLTGSACYCMEESTPFIQFLLESFIEIVADNIDKDNIVNGAIKSFIISQKNILSQ